MCINLSAMSRPEVVEFMRGSERKCGAYLNDARVPKSPGLGLAVSRTSKAAPTGTGSVCPRGIGARRGLRYDEAHLGCTHATRKSEPQKESKKTIAVEELDPANYKAWRY